MGTLKTARVNIAIDDIVIPHLDFKRRAGSNLILTEMSHMYEVDCI